MTRRTSGILAIIAALALVAVVAGFIVRGSIERALFLQHERAALGPDVDVRDAWYANATWDVHDLAVGADAAPFRIAATRATVASVDSATHVAMDRPIVTIARGVDAVDGATGLVAAFASFERSDPNADVRFHAGRIVDGDVTFDDVEGTFRVSTSGFATFDGTANVVVGGKTYPAAFGSATGAAAASGAVRADALPAALFAAFEPAGAAVAPVSGIIRDLVWDGTHGSARLEDVTFALGTHRLHGVHGAVILASGAIGSKKLIGSLDAVPFDAAGEIDDAPHSYRALYDGSRDARAIAELVRRIADEPALRSLHVDTAAPGLAYAQYGMQTEHGPLAISMLDVDPAEPTLRFDTAIAEDHVISNGERTSAMGVRTAAVAGVNGDYFDIGRTYQPQGMLVRGGEIVRGPVDRAALVIDDAKHVRFDEFHIAGSVVAAGRRFPITQLNDWPAGAVTVITTAFGKTLPAATGVTFAALATTDRANRYRVTSVTPATAPMPVTFGVAFGPAVHGSLHAGELVDVSYRLDPSVAHAVAAIGGGPILVRDGASYEDPHAPAPDERDYRWPVIALARRSDDRLLLVAADGRHPERSIGMTRPEFADLLVRLGAQDAMALDSGGSVTLVSRAPGDATVSVRNVPSDNSAERWVSDALFVYSSAPAPFIVAPAAAVTPSPEVRPTP